jgi:hypothetical protein
VGDDLKESGSFLKKRTKKLLRRCRRLARESGPSMKSFLVLFSKKNRFLNPKRNQAR